MILGRGAGQPAKLVRLQRATYSELGWLNFWASGNEIQSADNAPVAPQGGAEDHLDIPAFLRRQAT